MNQSELRANTRAKLAQSMGKYRRAVTIGFVFASDWLEKVAEIFNQLQSVKIQNQSNRGITFDIQFKTTLKAK